MPTSTTTHAPEIELPPDAATADDHRNPRRRRREAEEQPPEVGLLVQPETRHDLDSLVLHGSVRQDILAGLRAIEMREDLERVWQISRIQPQEGRCILNFFGPPGTGKTRAALGVALRLGKALYQVDYSAIISKYLGDTAKHISQAFNHSRIEADFAILAGLSRGLSGGDILNICVNAIQAGSVDADPAKWKVSQEMMEMEIRKAKRAEKEHEGRAKRRIGFCMGEAS